MLEHHTVKESLLTFFALPTYSYSLYKICTVGTVEWLNWTGYYRNPENKCLNKNLIKCHLAFTVQIPQGFVEEPFERLWPLEFIFSALKLIVTCVRYQR